MRVLFWVASGVLAWCTFAAAVIFAAAAVAVAAGYGLGVLA